MERCGCCVCGKNQQDGRISENKWIELWEGCWNDKIGRGNGLAAVNKSR
ncbi:hypothetical protein COLO4_07360 [Corchorus olitorius]|uniref:Uncharacterized protein n=1 Tax=Corchorus olitorius TaxID=93759 RepID=A0A1R3KK14_9ROSI|nr:hypothetical protein COLO4_07360 [Corchorus olitorius]